MNTLQAAIYARVSSEQQAEAKTIASQLAALQARVAADGLPLPAELQFVDEGYSGTTLVRPGLEQLRDLAAAGGVDRLYVHAPDRLARKYAYQALLLEEFQRAGVEVVFLNRALGETPEDELLLQVQGMVAEYERAKILERSRRGKRHAAHTGAVSVLSAAPYGYRYIGKADGGGAARYEIVLEEARVVRQIFTWVGQERATIGEVCRRLAQAGTPTRRGKATWDRTTVWGLLTNPAYSGAAAFGKTRAGPLQPRLRAQRGRSAQPRRAVTTAAVPPGGVDHGPGARARRRGAVRRGAGATAGEPASRPPAPAGRALPAPGAGHLRAVRLRLLWQGGQRAGGQGAPAGVRLLPLHRDRCLPLRRGARLHQQPGAHGSARRRGVGARAGAAGAAAAARG